MGGGVIIAEQYNKIRLHNICSHFITQDLFVNNTKLCNIQELVKNFIMNKTVAWMKVKYKNVKTINSGT